MNELKAGQILIAEPFLKDPNFARTVVLLCEHQAEGSFGFVLNKLTGLHLEDCMNDMEDLALPVYLGGPVETETLHFLHVAPDQIPGGQLVTDQIYWGGDFDTAIAALRSGSIQKEDIRFYLGYSGWSDGQLEEEMEDETWITTMAKRSIVFHENNNAIWKASLDLLGGSYSQMAHYPIDPQLN